MSEHPRFVCAREGHKPQVRLTGTLTAFVTSVISKCVRCGQMVETPIDSQSVPPAGKPKTASGR